MDDDREFSAKSMTDLMDSLRKSIDNRPGTTSLVLGNETGESVEYVVLGAPIGRAEELAPGGPDRIAERKEAEGLTAEERAALTVGVSPMNEHWRFRRENLEALNRRISGGGTAVAVHKPLPPNAADFCADGGVHGGLVGDAIVPEPTGAPRRYVWDREDQVMYDTADPEDVIYALDLSCYRPEEANGKRSPEAWTLKPSEHDFLDRAAWAFTALDSGRGDAAAAMQAHRPLAEAMCEDGAPLAGRSCPSMDDVVAAAVREIREARAARAVLPPPTGEARFGARLRKLAGRMVASYEAGRPWSFRDIPDTLGAIAAAIDADARALQEECLAAGARTQQETAVDRFAAGNLHGHTMAQGRLRKRVEALVASSAYTAESAHGDPVSVVNAGDILSRLAEIFGEQVTEDVAFEAGRQVGRNEGYEEGAELVRRLWHFFKTELADGNVIQVAELLARLGEIFGERADMPPGYPADGIDDGGAPDGRKPKVPA